MSDNDGSDNECQGIVQEFQHEAELTDQYTDVNGMKAIKPKESFFVALDTKKLMNALDLKKEVVLTMLNQMEKSANPFFKLHSNLHIGLQMRFHSKTLEQLAEASSPNA